LLACGVASVPVMAAFVVTATLLAPGYSHVSEAMSRLGTSIMPHPEIMNTGMMVYGLMVILFVLGLHRLFSRLRGASAFRYCLSLFGFGIVLAGIFPMDLSEAGSTSLEGILHASFTGLAYASLMLGVLLFARTVSRLKAWRRFSWATIGVVVLSGVIACLFFFGNFDAFSGLLQRLLFGVPALWLVGMGVRTLILDWTRSKLKRHPVPA